MMLFHPRKRAINDLLGMLCSVPMASTVYTNRTVLYRGEMITPKWNNPLSHNNTPQQFKTNCDLNHLGITLYSNQYSKV